MANNIPVNGLTRLSLLLAFLSESHSFTNLDFTVGSSNFSFSKYIPTYPKSWVYASNQNSCPDVPQCACMCVRVHLTFLKTDSWDILSSFVFLFFITIVFHRERESCREMSDVNNFFFFFNFHDMATKLQPE